MDVNVDVDRCRCLTVCTRALRRDMILFTQVTVSTVAPSPAHVARMSALNSAVAWSLHAADDAKRKRLVILAAVRVWAAAAAAVVNAVADDERLGP